jgi:hypothetical protein
MPKLEDSAKGAKSFGVMIYEPPYTGPAWFILSIVEGYGGVRGALATFGSQPSTRLPAGIYSLSFNFVFN